MAALNKSKCTVVTRSYSRNTTKRLFDSIRDGKDVVTFQTILLDVVDIDASDSGGCNLLMCACLQDRIEIVELLIKSGANVDLQRNDELGGTALHDVSEIGNLEIVKCLVENGADVNINDHMGLTAFHIASEQGHLEIVKCLVENGADINTREESGGCTSLYLALAMGHLEVGKYLVEKGADIDTKDKCGDTALLVASDKGYLNIVKFLLEKGADINEKNLKGETSVLRAAQTYSKDVVDLLIHRGANVDFSDEYKFTLLHRASGNGWLDTVQNIVKQNCDLNARDMYGSTALHDACEDQKLDIAEYLLQAGASWDIEDEEEYTPLNLVTREENPEYKFIKLFIENGAYLKHADYEGIVKSSSLKVLQDVKLCCQAIVNKFNNHDLPELYKLPASRSLPRIEEMRIASSSEVAEAIKRAVEFEILTKGHCNIPEARPLVLSVISVRSVLEYCEKKKSVL